MTETEMRWPSLPKGYFFKAKYLGGSNVLVEIRYGYGIFSSVQFRDKVWVYAGHEIVPRTIKKAEELKARLNYRLENEAEAVRKHNAIKSIKGDTK